MMVPKRRPPSPHSCRRSRSPLRQLAAAKPSQVMKANSRTKTVVATQLISLTGMPPQAILAPPMKPPSNPSGQLPSSSSLSLGCEVNDRSQDRADDHPKQLIPVEERHARKRRLRAVVERRPKHRDELDDEEQIPPAPFPARGWPVVHLFRLPYLDFKANLQCGILTFVPPGSQHLDERLRFCGAVGAPSLPVATLRLFHIGERRRH